MRIRQEKCRKCGTKIPPGNVCLRCKREDSWRAQQPPPKPQGGPTQCGICGKNTVRSGICGNPRCP